MISVYLKLSNAYKSCRAACCTEESDTVAYCRCFKCEGVGLKGLSEISRIVSVGIFNVGRIFSINPFSVNKQLDLETAVLEPAAVAEVVSFREYDFGNGLFISVKISDISVLVGVSAGVAENVCVVLHAVG